MNMELDILYGSWEWPDEELKTLGTIQEPKNRDINQGEKMGLNKNTKLMCQWLTLNPLKEIKEVTKIYKCKESDVIPCQDFTFGSERNRIKGSGTNGPWIVVSYHGRSKGR